MINSSQDDNRDKMNTGDSEFFGPKAENADNKLSSTMRSVPDSLATGSIFRSPKSGGALQQLSDLLSQNMKLDGLSEFKDAFRLLNSNFRCNLPTIPINDLRGEEAAAYTREECVLRRSLAALYRLIDVHGWTQSIYNHISARCTTEPNHFLINPFGLLYHEIQASNLVKIDEEGNVVQQGSTVLGVNKAGWTLHSALHAARSDVNCIIHLHLPDVIAVSCIRAGLLPVSPEATELIVNSGVRYHDYRGILVDEAERSSIQDDLGPKAKILFLRNHGVAVAATSVPEAWYLVKRVVAACQTQMRMLQLAGGASILNELKESATQLPEGPTTMTDSRPFADTDLAGQEDGPDKEDHSMMNGKAFSETGDLSWSPEELEFEAEMRVLDSAGFRTGHVYRQPNLLRRTHATSTWAGDTLGDQMTGAELLTTDFSATECSAIDDVAAAEAAGAQQVAKIVDHVKASRQRNAQRSQWLNKNRDMNANSGVVTSSMIASPASSQFGFVPRETPQAFQPSESPVLTPVKRSVNTDPIDSTSTVHGVTTPEFVKINHPTSFLTNGQSGKSQPLPVHIKGDDYAINKSATLPANVRHLNASANTHTTNTLQSSDGAILSGDDEKHKAGKKVKKQRSFRIPSFSRKKKN